MYLNFNVYGLIPMESKNSIREGVEKVVRWQSQDQVVEPDCYKKMYHRIQIHV
jgi:hypothetical protein